MTDLTTGLATSSPGNDGRVRGDGSCSRDEDGTILLYNVRVCTYNGCHRSLKRDEGITSWRSLCALGPPLYGNLCISFLPSRLVPNNHRPPSLFVFSISPSICLTLFLFLSAFRFFSPFFFITGSLPLPLFHTSSLIQKLTTGYFLFSL